MGEQRRKGRGYYTRLARVQGERYLRRRIQRCESGVSASDILQDVELKVADPIKSLPPDRIISFYMAAVANTLTDHIRRQAAKRKHLRKQTLSSAEQTPTKSTGLRTALLRKEQDHLLQLALKALSEEERQYIVLRHFEDLTVEKAAERLGLPKETYRFNYLKALRTLRRKYERLNGNG